MLIFVLLSELGVKEGELEPCLYPGGETEALARLKKYMERKVSGHYYYFMQHRKQVTGERKINKQKEDKADGSRNVVISFVCKF